ncbi:MAG TPA: hypothetical protein VN865_09735 [Candidatus Acidoferrales bacterium]|jgi:hypothetical protein|nr:hypothetical protein [Candidatus Acidoferrales bacterium]
MLNPSLPKSSLLTSFAIAIVAGFFLAAPSSLSAARPPRPVAMFANWEDSGKIVELAVGQQLVVKLPLRGYHDDSWHITQISPALKLIAGPDELRPAHWSPWKFSFQVFYFQRQAPGRVDLVLEPNYFLKPPMVLKVVDR